jgi:hypothetical protein
LTLIAEYGIIVWLRSKVFLWRPHLQAAVMPPIAAYPEGGDEAGETRRTGAPLLKRPEMSVQNQIEGGDND